MTNVEKAKGIFTSIKIMVINAEPSESDFASGGLWDEICKLCDQGKALLEGAK